MGQSPLSLLCHVLLASACIRAGSVHASQKSCANVVETRGARDAWRARARARHVGLAVDRTERSARSTRCPRTWGVLVAPLYICTVLFPASIFTFSFLNFMCSNFHLQPFFIPFEFFISKFCVTFISNFSISESFAWTFFGSLIFSCTKILHHDFSLQNLSMSKYSSPNFYVF